MTSSRSNLCLKIQLFKLLNHYLLLTFIYPFHSKPLKRVRSFLPLKPSNHRWIDSHLAMTVEDDAKAYHSFISAAVDITSVDVSSRQILLLRNNPPIHTHTISIVTSARDLDTNSRRSYLHSVSLGILPGIGQGDPLTIFSLPTNTMPMEIPTKVKVRSVSPSGNKVALLVEETDAGSTNKRDVLEIWTGHKNDEMSLTSTKTLIHRITLPTKKIHGKVSTDTVLNGPMPLSWNPEETYIAYCAERIATKTSSFFCAQDQEMGTVVVGGEHTQGIGKYEEWGEALSGIHPLIDVYIVNIR